MAPSQAISPMIFPGLTNYGHRMYMSKKHGMYVEASSEPSQVHLPTATVSRADDSDEERSSSCGSIVSGWSVSSEERSGPPNVRSRGIGGNCPPMTADSDLSRLADWKRMAAADPSLLARRAQGGGGDFCNCPASLPTSGKS